MALATPRSRSRQTGTGSLADQRARATPPRASGEFLRFITDISSVVTQHVEQWKSRLTEGIDYWRGDGGRSPQIFQTSH